MKKYWVINIPYREVDEVTSKSGPMTSEPNFDIQAMVTMPMSTCGIALSSRSLVVVVIVVIVTTTTTTTTTTMMESDTVNGGGGSGGGDDGAVWCCCWW